VDQVIDTETPGTSELAAPYLSVVVATRNDDHGGDPLQRLQAFVNTFDEQCRRTGLDAEVIVIDWNPPPDRPRVAEVLRLPVQPACTYRIVDVPPDLHYRFQHADVLPLFQMIAKNVGIRRARGRFVLATNIDVIFSTELVDWLASGCLEAERIYRVDRHDIESDFPVAATLAEKMAYCQTHQLRVHKRAGTHAVDPVGRERLLEPDIAGSTGITLGDGWHTREGDSTGGFFRWASREVRFAIDRTASQDLSGMALNVDLETNPYQPDSWIELDIRAGERSLGRRRVSGRTRLRLTLDEDSSLHEIAMRAISSSGGREWLPPFQNRDELWYRVHDLSLRATPQHRYDIGVWQDPPWTPRRVVRRMESSVELDTDRGFPNGARTAGFESPSDGVCEFVLEYVPIDGGFTLFARDEHDRRLPSTMAEIDQDGTRLLSLTLELKRGSRLSLVLASDQPDGTRSRCVVRNLRSSAPLRAVRLTDFSSRLGWAGRGLAAGAEALSLPVRALKRTARSLVLRRMRGFHQSMIERSDRVRDLESRLVALTDLEPVARLLKTHRPPQLHQNTCGDFQLMAREHWFALRGYPELEMFSMSIDGLMESLACTAGIREHILESSLCIYHLEHEKASGWTPEGEALLRKRIAERGITWLDSQTVDIWTAYMLWLGRPMIFNSAGWGLGDVLLAETTLQCVAGRVGR